MGKRLYTDEQDRWLRKNYPVLGRIQTAEAFNRIFQTNKSVVCLESHCKNQLSLHVSPERKAVSRVENAGRKRNIGDISKDIHGNAIVKTESGWKLLAEQVIGKKEGMVVVYLDGNGMNCNPENLMHVDRAIAIRMSKEHFWSTNPEVTKTGIIWCQLEKVLKNNNKIKEDI